MQYDDQTTEVNQFLTFVLGHEEFALEIGNVREVMDFTPITRVPKLPGYLRGVINLRGSVVSIVDLHLKLGMKPCNPEDEPSIVIVETGPATDRLQMGILVDQVQEVIHLKADQIAPPPKMGMRLNPDYIKGVTRRNDHVIIILSIEKILSGTELSSNPAENKMKTRESGGMITL